MSEPMDGNNRFRYFAPEPAASIPDGTVMNLELKTSREIMGERLYWIANSKKCPCCDGRGRVAIDAADPQS